MELIIAVFIFAFSAGITPGPNNIMIMTSGVNFGIQKSIPHFLGILFGFTLMFILIGLGFGAVFNRYPFLHEAIKVLGVLYLLFLSWKIASAAPKTLEAHEAKPFSFFQALLFQWVNPKAWVMATGAIAAFTSLETNIYAQVFTMALVFFICTFPCTGSWLIFGSFLKRLLKSTYHQRIFNISMAVLLIISFTPIAYDLIDSYIL